MQNNIIRSARSRLTVLGMAVGIGLFSITTITVPVHSGNPPASIVRQASDTTPGGVFGWD